MPRRELSKASFLFCMPGFFEAGSMLYIGKVANLHPVHCFASAHACCCARGCYRRTAGAVPLVLATTVAIRMQVGTAELSCKDQSVRYPASDCLSHVQAMG